MKITIKDISIQFMNSLKQILNGICEIIIGIYYTFGCFILLIKLIQNKKEKDEKQTKNNKKKAKKKE